MDDFNSHGPSLPQALLRYIPFVDQCEAGYEGLRTHEETTATVIFEKSGKVSEDCLHGGGSKRAPVDSQESTACSRDWHFTCAATIHFWIYM